MKAILMPLKGEAARNFEKFVSSNEKPKTRKTSKAKRAKIIAFINSVDKNESDNKWLCTFGSTEWINLY